MQRVRGGTINPLCFPSGRNISIRKIGCLPRWIFNSFRNFRGSNEFFEVNISSIFLSLFRIIRELTLSLVAESFYPSIQFIARLIQQLFQPIICAINTASLRKKLDVTPKLHLSVASRRYPLAKARRRHCIIFRVAKETSSHCRARESAEQGDNTIDAADAECR